ncbi:Hypothetical protein CKL_2865 [Clostridium kluyveri DSM 555]|uniref:Uncharacterized protein n=1 Tax=Clostridium kluyveri (strain ATCC 8527 / DSM 555 / NBRC 12016 / NCIMB 10680 / K1) TaxID=431943 RepID=A5N181_CLOK5|nr:Hypothetical protein CKL_2865 [Clostridium kluyveri DSM 555]
MIDLLKSGAINTRPLCEMAAHKDFVKLLADIEIYVDGIASMQVQNLNAYVNLARDTIEKKYRPVAVRSILLQNRLRYIAIIVSFSVALPPHPRPPPKNRENQTAKGVVNGNVE